MISPSTLEQYYNKFINNLNELLHDGVITVDLHLLERLNLLHYNPPGETEPELTRSFQLIESPEKITLINDQFVIWIAPRKVGQTISTLSLIALNHQDHPQLELAFMATGVYNTSQLVLRILEKLLLEIQENEDLIKSLDVDKS